MARSQLYLYTFVVILVLVLYFLSYINTLSDEFQFYSSYYPKYGEIYKLQYGNNIYENILNLYGSTLIPITVYYNCSYSNIEVPNYFNSTHVIVLNSIYQFLPTSAGINDVFFNIINNYSTSYSNNYCVFNGYEAYNSNFNISLEFSGNPAYYTYFYNNNVFSIDNYYLNNLNNIQNTYNFKYINNYDCLYGEISENDIQYNLPTISISYLNLSNATISNNIISVNILNNNICPVNLNDIYYGSYNISKFDYNFNTSNNNYIINSGQQISANYNYTYDTLYFCLESLGMENCVPINNLPINYYVPINIYNNQNIATPEPFQQEIYIPNTLNLSSYIDSNGQNILFFNPYSGQLYYSWFEGDNGTGYIWWINIPTGINANSSIIINIGIGSTSEDYYQLYYPYVGASYNVLGTFNYDNIGYVMNPGLMYQIYVNYSSWTTLSWPIQYEAPLTPGTCINNNGYLYCANWNVDINGSLPSLGTTQNVNGNSEPYVEVNWQWLYSGGSPYPNPPISNPSPEGVNEEDYGWMINFIGFVQVQQSNTYIYSGDDDGFSITYSVFPELYVGFYNWTTDNPNYVISPSSAYYIHAFTVYSGSVPVGDYAFGYYYFEGSIQAYTSLWSNNPVYYYSPALPPNGVMPSISIGNINSWPP